MTVYDREDRIECDLCDSWAEHKWHVKADDFEDDLLATKSKLASQQTYITDLMHSRDALGERLDRAQKANADYVSRLDSCESLLLEATQNLERYVNRATTAETRLDSLRKEVAGVAEYLDGNFDVDAGSVVTDLRRILAGDVEKPCPNALLPDGPVCPRCGGRRGPSGIDGGSWVHY